MWSCDDGCHYHLSQHRAVELHSKTERDDSPPQIFDATTLLHLSLQKREDCFQTSFVSACYCTEVFILTKILWMVVMGGSLDGLPLRN